jgi:hypothetical protein
MFSSMAVLAVIVTYSLKLPAGIVISSWPASVSLLIRVDLKLTDWPSIHTPSVRCSRRPYKVVGPPVYACMHVYCLLSMHICRLLSAMCDIYCLRCVISIVCGVKVNVWTFL